MPQLQILPFTVGLGTMLLAAHTSGMSAVFPLLVRELGSDAVRGQWILTAYTLTLSASLLMFGTIADRIGLKQVYIAGIILFGIGSACSLLAPNLAALVASRALAALGAAMVSSTSIALIGFHVPSPHLGRAVGWQTGLTYAGLALGPAIAGYVFSEFGWRAVFALNVPAAVLTTLCAFKLPNQVERLHRPILRFVFRTEVAPVLAWAGTIVSIMIALLPRSPHLIAALCAAGFAIILVRTETSDAGPLTLGQLFRSTRFAGAVIAETTFYFSLHAIGFLIPLYLANGRLLDAVQIGIFLAAQNGARATAAALGGWLCDRFGSGALTCSGAFLLALAAWGLVSLDAETPTWRILVLLILVGIGGGVFAPANSKVLLGAVSTDGYGSATAILSTARNLGMAFGVGAAASLYFEFGGRTGTFTTLQAVHPAFVIIACGAMVCAMLAIQFSLGRNERQARFAQP